MMDPPPKITQEISHESSVEGSHEISKLYHFEVYGGISPPHRGPQGRSEDAFPSPASSGASCGRRSLSASKYRRFCAVRASLQGDESEFGWHTKSPSRALPSTSYSRAVLIKQRLEVREAQVRRRVHLQEAEALLQPTGDRISCTCSPAASPGGINCRIGSGRWLQHAEQLFRRED